MSFVFKMQVTHGSVSKLVHPLLILSEELDTSIKSGKFKQKLLGIDKVRSLCATSALTIYYVHGNQNVLLVC